MIKTNTICINPSTICYVERIIGNNNDDEIIECFAVYLITGRYLYFGQEEGYIRIDEYEFVNIEKNPDMISQLRLRDYIAD